MCVNRFSHAPLFYSLKMHLFSHHILLPSLHVFGLCHDCTRNRQHTHAYAFPFFIASEVKSYSFFVVVLAFFAFLFSLLQGWQLGCVCLHPTCSPEGCDHVYLFDNDYSDAKDIYGKPMSGRFPYDEKRRIILEVLKFIPQISLNLIY